ncbi:unnamed protein product [Absidia cylindrospora]
MSSSSSEQKTNEEPVKVTNVYDTTQLKMLSMMNSPSLLKRIAVFIAAGSFLYEREYGFDYGKFGTLGCVIAFWFLQAASFLYTRFVQNNEAFVGYLYQGDDHVGTLSVTTNMDRYSPDYNIKYMYSDLKKRKDHRVETTSTAAEWFTEDGTLVETKFNDQIKASVNSVTKHLHKD